MNALLPAALSALLVVLSGCRGPGHATPPEPKAAPAQPAQAAQTRTTSAEATDLRRAADASPTGVLVVGAALVKRCPGLAAMKTHPPAADDDAAWLAILQSLASCMDRGDLKSAKLVVTGGEHAGAMVRYVLAKMGIDRERVEVMNVDDEEQCDLDDQCSYFTVRVDLAPPSGVVRANAP